MRPATTSADSSNRLENRFFTDDWRESGDEVAMLLYANSPNTKVQQSANALCSSAVGARSQQQPHALSMAKPIIKEFDHLVLKVNEPAFVAPPIVETVSARLDGMHDDTNAARGYLLLECPAHAAGRE